MSASDDAGPCALTRALAFVGERWSFFVLREALAGATRFSEFRATLGVASDVLTARLATLVEGGILERRAYREPGQRARESYHLTEKGRELSLVVAALQQWGDRHLPCAGGPDAAYRAPDGRPVAAGFVDEHGAVIPCGGVRVEREATAR